MSFFGNNFSVVALYFMNVHRLHLKVWRFSQVFNKYFAYLYSPVVGIEQYFSQGHNLWCSVPAIRAVDEHRPPLLVHSIHYSDCSSHQAAHVLQPFSGFYALQPADKHKNAKNAKKKKPSLSLTSRYKKWKWKKTEKICHKKLQDIWFN